MTKPRLGRPPKARQPQHQAHAFLLGLGLGARALAAKTGFAVGACQEWLDGGLATVPQREACRRKLGLDPTWWGEPVGGSPTAKPTAPVGASTPLATLESMVRDTQAALVEARSKHYPPAEINRILSMLASLTKALDKAQRERESDAERLLKSAMWRSYQERLVSALRGVPGALEAVAGVEL